MSDVLIPLARGFEEIEAVTLIDLLRRADINVTTAALNGLTVIGAHQVSVLADTTLDEVASRTFDMVVLPGGLPGADHLNADPRIHTILKRHQSEQWIGAICAAPKVLLDAGVADDLELTAYPGVLAKETSKVSVSEEAVVCDGKVITSRSPGTAIDFALKIIETLKGKDKCREIEASLVRS